jgi:pilus assembly protein CpaB
MNLKKALPLAVALIMGLIAARLMVQIIRSKVQAQVPSGVRTVRVVVTAHSVSAGDQLDADALTVSQMAADSAPAQSFDDPSEVAGRVAAAPLVSGQAVVEPLLAPKGSASGLQAVIPPGMRAITVDVNEVSGVAGYITEGSRVDLLQTLHDDETNQFVSRCLVQDILVTAVGKRTVTAAIADPQAATSVTLLVTPKQAQLLDLASVNGHPRLILRSTRDNRMDEMTPVAMTELTGGIHKPAFGPVVTEVEPARLANPFAAATQPAVAAAAAPARDWPVRVIAGGAASTVDLNAPPQGQTPAVTGVGGP